MENISQMSLLEVALQIMDEKGGIVNIYDLIAEVLNRKGMEDTDGSIAAKLYIDITTSSKFVYMGEDNWDLKARQSLDQFDKDGASFNPKNSEIDEDEDDEDLDESDIDEEDLDDEDDEDDDDKDEDDDEDDDEDKEEESEYIDDEDEEDLDDDEDDDRSIDEDKYNEYMDDYEDLYES